MVADVSRAPKETRHQRNRLECLGRDARSHGEDSNGKLQSHARHAWADVSASAAGPAALETLRAAQYICDLRYLSCHLTLAVLYGGV